MKRFIVWLMTAAGFAGAFMVLAAQLMKLDAQQPNIVYMGEVKDLSVYWLARGNCVLVVYRFRGDTFQLRCGR